MDAHKEHFPQISVLENGFTDLELQHMQQRFWEMGEVFRLRQT